MNDQKPEKSEPQWSLPSDFYIRLLNLPACKQGKPCDGCGRCEH